MESIAIAFEKLAKVYNSCTTVKQYVKANTYRRLFWKMYGNSIYETSSLRNEIISEIDYIEKESLHNIVKPIKEMV